MITKSNNLIRLARHALLILALALLAPLASAAAPANDNASNSAYDSGWANGSNGGTGMGGWTLSTSGAAGHFIGNSGCDIAIDSDCWGMYANSGGLADAVRTFNSAMNVGEVFTIYMDNGSIQTGGSVGFGLRNSSSQNVLEFYFSGGASNYTVADGTGTGSTGLAYTDQGLETVFTFTSPTFYHMQATRLTDSASVRMYRKLGQTDKTVANLRLFNFEAGSGDAHNLYFNSIAVSQPTAPSGLVVNEIDYDNPGTDDAEFIEIKNTSGASINLDDYDLLLINGVSSGTDFYRVIDLPSVSLAAGDYYVVCGQSANVPNCDHDVTPDTELIQNGEPDAVALAHKGVIVDTVSYGGSSASPFTENTGVSTSKNDHGDNAFVGLSRIVDGVDSNHNDNDFQRVCITPGLANVNSTACANAYVATGGSDSANNCASSTAPCLTVARGVGRAGKNDTINVAGGAYAEQVSLDDGALLHWSGGGGGNDWQFQSLTIKTTSNSGAVTAPPGTLTLAGTGSIKPSLTNNGTFTHNGGTVAFVGQSNNNAVVAGNNATTFYNVSISANSGVFGVDMYNGTVSATINGTLTINSGGFVAHAENGGSNIATDGSPLYGNGSTLRYNTGNSENDDFDAFAEWAAGQTSTARGVPDNVLLANNTWVGMRQNAGVREMRGNLTIDAGSGLDLGVSGSSTTKANGVVTNNGTIKQTATVNASSFHFANIKDTSSSDKYYGVLINTAGNMGQTTVWVDGNQNCPNLGAGVSQVKRCYRVTPGSAQSATATFYYRYNELNGQTPSTLKLWKYQGSGVSWAEPTNSGYVRSACNSGDNNCSVEVSGVTLGSTYLLASLNPTAITLAEFSAQQVGDHVRVSWETVSEIDNRGFNLYRGTSPAGWDRQLNSALIPSQGQGSPSGFTYTWDDHADLVVGTTYYYWLEDLDLSGALTMHGPVSVDFSVPTAVTLSGVSASPGLDTLRYSTHAAGAAALPWLWVVAAATGAALGVRRMRR